MEMLHVSLCSVSTIHENNALVFVKKLQPFIIIVFLNLLGPVSRLCLLIEVSESDHLPLLASNEAEESCLSLTNW